MRMVIVWRRAGLALVAAAEITRAQASPVIRQIGPLEHVSADSFGLKSATIALAMSGGRVMINDMIGRRVLLLDSTLARATIVADTTSATSNSYGTSQSTLLRYRGDSALLWVPSTLSIFVLGPNGATARVMAVPRPNDVQSIGLFGAPGIDERGRVVYFSGIGVPGIPLYGTDMQLLQDGKATPLLRMMRERGDRLFNVGKVQVDSAPLLRLDFESRAIDTAAWLHIPKYDREVKVNESGVLVSLTTTPDPLPSIDQWSVLRDGSIAVVRGRDLHVEWIDASGKHASSQKIAFDWQKVTDARKASLIDSTVAFWQKAYDDRVVAWLKQVGGGAGGSTRSAMTAADAAPHTAARANPSDLPDYFPPFGERSVSSDLDNNVWVQTTQIVDGRPVFDVIDRRGVLIDRVQLPAHRTIAGFGPGVIFLAVADGTGKVRVERTRVK